VLEINLWPKEADEPEYSLSQIDIKGQFVEYDWFLQTTRKITSDDKILHDLEKNQANFCVHAPILPNGKALIGDVSKCITSSKKQFIELYWGEQMLGFTLNHANGDEVTILIQSPNEPTKVELNGKIFNKWTYEGKIITINFAFEKTADARFYLKF